MTYLTLDNVLITLAVLGVVLMSWSIGVSAVSQSVIFPPIMPATFFFGLSIGLVVWLQISALNLIWLLVVSLILGVVVMFFAPVQKLCMMIFTGLAFAGRTSSDEAGEGDVIRGDDKPDGSKPDRNKIIALEEQKNAKQKRGKSSKKSQKKAKQKESSGQGGFG